MDGCNQDCSGSGNHRQFVTQKTEFRTQKAVKYESVGVMVWRVFFYHGIKFECFKIKRPKLN